VLLRPLVGARGHRSVRSRRRPRAVCVLVLGVLLVGACASAQARAVRARPGRSGHGFDVALTPPVTANDEVLAVGIAGTGSGTIASTDGQISCGSVCSASYPAESVVTLVATPAPGSFFVGWAGGGCSGTGACVVVMTAATAVAAGFQALTPPTRITGTTIDADHHVVSLRFTAAGPTSAFMCGLAPTGATPHLAPCTSPKSYDDLDPGVYEFTVEGIGLSGSPGAAATRRLSLPITFVKCWGAAARDPEHPCKNPALTDVVFPTPSEEPLVPSGFCRGEHLGPITMCSFGVEQARARGTIAVIGDSHAAALEPGMEYVAQAERWHGLAYIHNGCGFSDALMAVVSSYQAGCHIWDQAAKAWLWANPEISTVMISAADRRYYVTSARAGFQDIWRSLPPWIHAIFVVRDVPHAAVDEAACVARALAQHVPADPRCAQPRSTVLTYDSEAAAAADSRSPRVHLIDLTPFLCDARRCFPVVGGVMVLGDLQHLSIAFSLTLGPYLLRSIEGAGRSRRRGRPVYR
jgi:hypothetical protein